MAAIGPSAICRLNLNDGDVETLITSDKHDYLLPKVAADCTIYCIRAPYQGLGGYPLRFRLLDVLLFPWRLLVAIFAFLNVFSMFFAKKPLTMAGGPNQQPVDLSKRILHNRVINVQETMTREKRRAAVSREWKLIRLENSREVEIASNVLWFELDANGEPIYTDGFAVYDRSGAKRHECDELVTALACSPIAVPTEA